MKKFAIFTLVLALGAMMLAGCGCMNTKPEVPTLPTNGETTSPTLATQAPTTEAATMPTTMATTAPSESGTDTTGPLEGAMDDITGTDGANGNAGDTTVPGRSGGRMMPRK
jgi:PBP1b-binding outer membrane lipoprotein LpoB